MAYDTAPPPDTTADGDTATQDPPSVAPPPAEQGPEPRSPTGRRRQGRNLLGWARRVRITGRLGLRARITLAFALGALLLSALLAVSTWGLTRENLLSQRESTALRQVYTDARTVREQLTRSRGSDAPEAGNRELTALQALPSSTSSRPILAVSGEGDVRWIPLESEFGQDALPDELKAVVSAGDAARMRYDLNGVSQLAVGVPIPAINASYYEIVSLEELESTLESLGISLLGAALVTTLAGAGLGWWASRRALRPLAEVSTAAEAIAGGRLDTRLEAIDDVDLAVLASSFNHMAQALEERIERDARFASDVSHELRSPLMTLAASIEVMAARREDLPERAQAALDLMVADVARFQQLVADLLEISRFDAGQARLELDEVRLAELVMQAVATSSEGDVPVDVAAELVGTVVRADKRRLVRVIANLLDNATKYGRGATAVLLDEVDGGVHLTVEDNGPGVAPEERALIFERFSRGTGASRRSAGGAGVGLGLALVAEHVHLQGGRVWVEGRRDGAPGARFVVELPVAQQ
ncbi:HAMP domain-containing sensor histidine kinase [soil metagenome]